MRKDSVPFLGFACGALCQMWFAVCILASSPTTTGQLSTITQMPTYMGGMSLEERGRAAGFIQASASLKQNCNYL